METERLIIRPTVWEDLDIFYEWELLPEVTQFFSIKDNQTKEDVVRKYIADAEAGFEQYTIVLKETGLPIGRIVITDIIEGWKA